MTPDEYDKRITELGAELLAQRATEVELSPICDGADECHFLPSNDLHGLPEKECRWPQEHHVFHPVGIRVEYVIRD